MNWDVRIKKRCIKQINGLPVNAKKALDVLVAEIRLLGPVRGNWANYGKLSKNRHHCHIKKGKPTYVAVWEEHEEGIQIIEVIYVGTHEKAQY